VTFIKAKEYCRRVFRNAAIFMVLCFLLVSTAAAAQAEIDGDAGPFRKGSIRMTLLIGSGTAYRNDYTIFGLGAAYYAADGIEVGLDGESWSGADPRIYRVSPGVRYIFYSMQTIKPYVGAFYRHSFVEGFSDRNAVGVRAGGIILSGERSYVGAGAASSVYLNCSETADQSCGETYAEILIGFTF
jgi:hypothetical protein